MKVNKINRENAEKFIKINDNNFVVLLDYFDPIFMGNKELAANNIFLLDNVGYIKWKVHTEILVSGGFVNILIKENKLKAISWDTGLYGLDIETGLATPEMLLK